MHSGMKFRFKCQILSEQHCHVSIDLFEGEQIFMNTFDKNDTVTATLTSRNVKELMLSLGADLCGIASMDRFDGAPEGFHPLDVMPSCKSVISFGCRFHNRNTAV